MFLKRGSAGQCNATQSPRSKYRCFNISLVDKPMAELATWALRLKVFRENASLSEGMAGFRESWLCFTIGRGGNN